jgi:hypothetical protein
MAWYDNIGGYLGAAGGGVGGFLLGGPAGAVGGAGLGYSLGNQISSSITGGPNGQDPTNVPGIGAGQNTNASGGTNLGQINLPYFQQDRDRINGMLAGQSPFASQDWGSLISQLQQRASGAHPENSLAVQNFNMAQGQQNANLSSLANSGDPGARQAAIQAQGRVAEGNSAGLALAGTQEQQAAQAQLGQTLSARDQLNQNAYLNMLQQQLGLSTQQLHALGMDQQFTVQQNQINQQNQAAQMGALGSLAGALAKLNPGGGGAAAPTNWYAGSGIPGLS